MSPAFEIRAAGRGDLDALDALYGAAFPEEELRPLMRALLAAPSGVLSRVAVGAHGVIGHIALTRCGVPGAEDRLALLGPLAVAPERQRRGVGSALIRDGLRRMAEAAVAQICVLGDPAYYGRFGFEPETEIAPPYPLPPAWRAAWRSIRLADQAPLAGLLQVPPVWRRPELWRD